jgi:hypothetical protein
MLALLKYQISLRFLSDASIRRPWNPHPNGRYESFGAHIWKVDC